MLQAAVTVPALWIAALVVLLTLDHHRPQHREDPERMGIWADIPDGYYAVQDPADASTITYWRRHRSSRADSFKAWPAKARYGPAPVTRAEANAADDVPALLQDWSRRYRAYLDQVAAAVLEDVPAAGRRFADLKTRCCICARPLQDSTSKTYGIGPDCRGGIAADALGRYFTPVVGRAHADRLAEEASSVR